MLIAVTGGIGSGKSEVTEILKNAGATILSADDINAEMLQSLDYIEKVRNLFPSVVENGAIVRKKLGAIIFSDESARKKLNALAHPLIICEMKRRAAQCLGLVVVEIPLFFESESRLFFDKTVVVTAPTESRVRRVSARDDVTEEYANSVILSQVSEEKLRSIATDVIENVGSREELYQKVRDMLHAWGLRM